jgi:hypothetical protein
MTPEPYEMVDPLPFRPPDVHVRQVVEAYLQLVANPGVKVERL